MAASYVFDEIINNSIGQDSIGGKPWSPENVTVIPESYKPVVFSKTVTTSTTHWTQFNIRFSIGVYPISARSVIEPEYADKFQQMTGWMTDTEVFLAMPRYPTSKDLLYHRERSFKTRDEALKDAHQVAARLDAMTVREFVKTVAPYQGNLTSKMATHNQRNLKSKRYFDLMRGNNTSLSLVTGELARIAQTYKETLTKQEFENMVQRAWNKNMREYYREDEDPNAPKTWRQWLERDSDEVGMTIENDGDLYNLFLHDLPENTTVYDLIAAYQSGQLPNIPYATPVRITPEFGPLASPVDIKPWQYSPKNELTAEQAKEYWQTSRLRASGGLSKKVQNARKEIFLAFQTDPTLAEKLGIDKKEIQKTVLRYSGTSVATKRLHEQLNANVPPEHQWTGLINSNYLGHMQISPEDIDKFVKSITVTNAGETSGYFASKGQLLRKDIIAAFLAIDSGIEYTDLNFTIGSFAPKGTKYRGDYHDKERTINIYSGGSNTLYHEVGHYLDFKFAREIGFEGQPFSDVSMTVNWDIVGQKVQDPEHIAWCKKLAQFTRDIQDRASTHSEYTQRPTEVFARFTDAFVTWVQKNGGRQWYSSESGWGDNFTYTDFTNFIRLLQEKSLIDAKKKLIQPRQAMSRFSAMEWNPKPHYRNSPNKIRMLGSPEPFFDDRAQEWTEYVGNYRIALFLNPIRYRALTEERPEMFEKSLMWETDLEIISNVPSRYGIVYHRERAFKNYELALEDIKKLQNWLSTLTVTDMRKLHDQHGEKLAAIAPYTVRNDISDELQEKYPQSEVDLRTVRPIGDKQVVDLEWLFVQKGYRKKGVGSQVMQDIVQWADDNDVILTLTLADKNKDWGTTSRERLRRFYSQFGFVTNKGRNKNYRMSIFTSMYRLPKPRMTTAAKKGDGVFIALFLDSKTAKKLAIDGGEKPEELHVTLCFNEDFDFEKTDQVFDIVEGVAAEFSPLTGTVGGFGRFTGESEVLYASPDVKGLTGLREEIAQRLTNIDVSPAKQHGYTPHITLKILEADEIPSDPDVSGVELTFNEIHVCIGDKEKNFPLTGGKKTARQAMEEFEIAGFCRTAASRAEYLTSLGATPEIIQWIESQDDKNQKWYINEFRKNPSLTLEQLQDLEPPQGFVPSPYEQRQAEHLPEGMQKWFLTQCRKHRIGPLDLLYKNLYEDYKDNPEKLQEYRQGIEEDKAHGRLFTYRWPAYAGGNPTDNIPDFRNMADWFRATNPDIASLTYEQARNRAHDWHETMAARGAGKMYEPTNPANIVYQIPTPEQIADDDLDFNRDQIRLSREFPGWTVQKVTSTNDLKCEGNKMHHCVGSYANEVAEGKTEIYSVRDQKNEPHVTIEVKTNRRGNKFTEQIKGHSNKYPKQFMPIVELWGEDSGIEIHDEDHVCEEWERDPDNEDYHVCTDCGEREEHEWGNNRDFFDDEEDRELYHICDKCRYSEEHTYTKDSQGSGVGDEKHECYECWYNNDHTYTVNDQNSEWGCEFCYLELPANSTDGVPESIIERFDLEFPNDFDQKYHKHNFQNLNVAISPDDTSDVTIRKICIICGFIFTEFSNPNQQTLVQMPDLMDVPPPTSYSPEDVEKRQTVLYNIQQRKRYPETALQCEEYNNCPICKKWMETENPTLGWWEKRRHAPVCGRGYHDPRIQPKAMMELLEISGFCRTAATRAEYLTSLGATPDIIAFIEAQPEDAQKWYINEFRKNPQLQLTQLQQLQAPTKEPPYTNREMVIASGYSMIPGFEKWILAEYRKHRFMDISSQYYGQQPKKETIYSYKFPETGDQFRTQDWDAYVVANVWNLIYDWLRATNAEISSYTFQQAWDAQKKWHEEEAAKGNGSRYQNRLVVYELANSNPEWQGWTIQQVASANDLACEGNKMGHCVGSYADQVESGASTIYSLRDPQNEPHVTIEFVGDTSDLSPQTLQNYTRHGNPIEIEQIQGKGNKTPIKKYQEMIKAWFQSLGVENLKMSGDDEDKDIYNAYIEAAENDDSTPIVEFYSPNQEGDEYGLIKYVTPPTVKTFARDIGDTLERCEQAGQNRYAGGPQSWVDAVAEGFAEAAFDLDVAVQRNDPNPQNPWAYSDAASEKFFEAADKVQDRFFDYDTGIKHPDESDEEFLDDEGNFSQELYDKAVEQFQEDEQEVHYEWYKETVAGSMQIAFSNKLKRLKEDYVRHTTT